MRELFETCFLYCMDFKALATSLALKLDISRQDVSDLCEALSGVLGDAAAEMDSASIPAFGSFEPKKRAERVALHPATGRRMLLPPKVVLTFRPSAVLRRKVRGGDIGIPDEEVNDDGL